MLDFLIVGAQKSASTLIHKILMEHAFVDMPNREIPWFEDPEYADFSEECFEKYFQQGEGKIRGIKRPNLFHLDYAPERIREKCPGAKIVISLRDPVSRAVSAYYHYIQFGFLPVEDINIGLPRLVEGHYDKRFPRAGEVIEFGRYDAALKRYLTFFDRRKLHVSTMEDVVTDKEGYSRSLFEFLEIPYQHIYTQNANKGVYSLWRLKYIQMINRIRFRYNEEGTRVYPRLPRKWKWLVYPFVAPDKLFLKYVIPNTKPSLDESVSRLLRSVYAESVARCEDLLSRDLSAWKQ